MRTRILAVDDDRAMCEMIEAGLDPYGFDVVWRTRAEDALQAAEAEDFSAVVTDLNLSTDSGLDVCRRLSELRPDLPVVVITAFGDMQSAISAIRVGARDFINKPVEMETLAHSLRRATEEHELRREVKRLTEEVRRSTGVGELVGRSSGMRKVYELISRVSDTDASVVLTGESGTGKELVARALHTESRRADGPFVAVNCAAVPATLLESELFGHVRGAFTDASTRREGLFQRANRGTVLLDEIGEMPTDMQAKLLRVLQDKRVRPVGATEEIPFDARIVAATNRDLEDDVENGRFREDLFYRLNVVRIHVPPLRARGNDILLLAQHFVERASERLQRPVKGISAEAAKKLLGYDWPGNVRQLENWMERAVTLTRFEQITPEDLPDKIRERGDTGPVDIDQEHMSTLSDIERRYIERVLSATGGNKTQASRILGLDRRTLYRKLERYEQER